MKFKFVTVSSLALSAVANPISRICWRISAFGQTIWRDYVPCKQQFRLFIYGCMYCRFSEFITDRLLRFLVLLERCEFTKRTTAWRRLRCYCQWKRNMGRPESFLDIFRTPESRSRLTLLPTLRVWPTTVTLGMLLLFLQAWYILTKSLHKAWAEQL